MKKRSRILILVIVLGIVLGSSIYHVKKIKAEKIGLIAVFETSLREEEWIAQLFPGRQYLQEEHTLTIGNKIKELQNDYFDVKFMAQNEEVLIYINRLSQEKNQENLIETAYLTNIVTFWKDACRIGWDMEEQEKIIKLITDCYVSIRSSVEYVDQDTLIFPEKWKPFKQPKIQASVENNMLVLSCQF